MPPNMRWFTTGGEVVPPVGLIVGLKSGESIPTNWAAFTDANGVPLKGTNSDVLAGTFTAGDALSLTVGTGGAHSSGTSQNVYAYGSSNSGPAHTTSRDYSNVGSHASHTVGIDYTPKQSNMRLIQAGADAKFEASLLMFSLDARSKHTAFSSFDGNGALLAASTDTNESAQTAVANVSSSASNSHDHIKTETHDAWELLTNLYTAGGGTAGGAHTHTGGTPTITPAHRKALVRAWEIVGADEMEGMIGMWVDSGVPDGWEVVTELVDVYVGIDAAGDGSVSGDNTLNISGTTGSTGHSHAFTGGGR